MTTKQQKITKRQELLSELIPGAISCEYIASVNRVLPNGFIVKSINININGFAYQLLAFKGSESKFFYSKKSVSIQGVDVYYITLHGGERKGAGRPELPPQLKKEATKTMRIPISKIPAVLKAIGKSVVMQVPQFEELLQVRLAELPYTKHLDDGQYNDGQAYGFECGARWAYEKLSSGT